MKPIFTAVAALFILTAPVVFPAAGLSIAMAEDSPIPTMTLNGTGEVSSEPDMAIVTSGLTTQGKTAREALDANNVAMREIFAVLESADIAPIDIQTSNFSVQPEYNRNSSSNSQRITGYAVSNNVTVTVRDLDNLGKMLDSFVTVGANQIFGVNFSVSETDGLFEAARNAAVADAMAKAELYAQAANFEIKRILSISEGGRSQPQMQEMAMMRMAADSSVPVSGGQLTFSSTVSISWEIAQ